MPSVLRRHRVYRLDLDEEAYQVWHGTDRDETIHVHISFEPWGELIDKYHMRERSENIAERTRTNGRPRDMCRLGWHRSTAGLWFRLANGGIPGTLIVYYAGSRPTECACSTIKSLSGQTLRCTVCGNEIAKGTSRLEEA